MEIRDVLHGAIAIENSELPIVDSKFFQRLRHIKQLGFSEYSFPSASHSRYIHSMGAMHTASLAYESIFETEGKLPQFNSKRFKKVLRLGALLHDIGHGPLSHTSEIAMPKVATLKVPGLESAPDRQATHEDYTLKILLDSELTPALEADPEFKPVHIAALIDSSIQVPDDFFIEKINGQSVDFRPILSQLISSELDADRMDYLRRDSLNAGVSYGEFDADWVIANLTGHVVDGKCSLALQHRALYAFEDFLISRFHMFLMVYFHYKGVIYDEMLKEYFNSPDADYVLPSSIEDYIEYNDAHLFTHLAKSPSPWAKRISDKKPYRMLMEVHSGIPATDQAHEEQRKLLEEAENNLSERKIHYLVATSTGELSKYFRKPGAQIYVRYDNHYSAPAFIPLQKCTDLFMKYSEKRSITRLYVSPEDYEKCRNDRRKEALSF